MSKNTFEVVFSGEILAGQDTDAVKANVAKLFKADDAQIARLFSGNESVIKKNLDEQTANKYVSAFKNAGAIAIARDTAAPVAPQPAAQTVAEPAPQTVTSTAAETTTSSESQEIAPPPQTAINLDANPDLSDFSLRPQSGNLVDPAAETPEPSLDISEFSLAPPGSDLADKTNEPPPAEPDISELSLSDN